MNKKLEKEKKIHVLISNKTKLASNCKTSKNTRIGATLNNIYDCNVFFQDYHVHINPINFYSQFCDLYV